LKSCDAGLKIVSLIKTTFNRLHLSPTLVYQIAFSQLHGIGNRRGLHILSKIDCLESFFDMSLLGLHKLTGIHRSILVQMKRKEALERAQKAVDYVSKHEIQTHFYLDSNYPRRLKHCPDAPLMLYSKGCFNPNPDRVVAVVGTRKISEYGKTICRELFDCFSSSGIQVISGLAYGVDVLSHRLCVENGIPTVGVLGHGLDRIYPQSHRGIAERMLQNGGLMTEFLEDTNPDRENFPMRNRIVSGLSDALIVVESGEKGGSIITASLSNDYHRDVFAFPGDYMRPTSMGCNLLIQQNKAQLICSGKDFLKQMQWENHSTTPNSVQQHCLIELNEDENKLLECLNNYESKHIDTLSYQVQFPISKVSVLLFQLEMKGMLRTLPGKMYRLN
jgi:DNA processing protein